MPLEVPAIVARRRLFPDAETQAAAPPPANDDRSGPGTSPQHGKKSAIVTASKRGRRPKPEPEIDADEEARGKAFVARMMRPP